MKLNLSKEPRAYCVRGQQQMSLFSEKELAKITPQRRRLKKLFCLFESPDGYSWWQEIERKKGESPWTTCIRYRDECLGKGYWICTYELRY